ncbi:MAG: hypothetical protein NZM06_08735 [Chloroherpetonaceae bacterium]|nr:hypothetical protein [Chloroherpetonaceae bacterium]MDW8436899.1 hypothetical protein [Chloroherpetonaceae bacterium]
MNAYDIIISETGKDGWCGGMPPGIKPAQWCRSRKSGLPMKHLFTVRVPEEYRARGKTFVAISVFQDLTDKRIEGVEESFRRKQVNAKRLKIPFWKNLSDYLAERHAQEVFAKHNHDDGWAWIWLTEKEFAALMCEPPPLDALDAHLGIETRNDLFFEPRTQKLKLSLRKGDINAGKALNGFPKWERAINTLNEAEIEKIIATEYIPMFSELGRRMKLERFWSYAHFGGTASPATVEPPFSPAYLEFDESLGNPNLGGDGACQIDLLNEKLAWACG